MTRIDPGRGTDPYSQAGGSAPHEGRGGLDAGLSRFGTARSNTDGGFETHRDFREEAGSRQDLEAMFSARMRQALSTDADHGKTDDGQASDRSGELRLLASAAPATGIPGMDRPEAVRDSPQIRADLIAARVAAALDAADRPVPGAPLTLRLQMPELADAGIAGLALTMTGDQLDISLTPVAGGLPENLQAAAQALADRLSQRFPTRKVRIFEAAPTETATIDADADRGSMSQISALLSR